MCHNGGNGNTTALNIAGRPEHAGITSATVQWTGEARAYVRAADRLFDKIDELAGVTDPVAAKMVADNPGLYGKYSAKQVWLDPTHVQTKDYADGIVFQRLHHDTLDRVGF